MKAAPLILGGLIAVSSLPARAHDLQYTVSGAQAVVLRLFYIDDKPFAFEAYEIYRTGEKLPYQVGRTDGQGRVAFLPDRAATWRVKAISEDGHGLDFNLSTDAAAQVATRSKPFYERYGRIVVGIAVILGLFGLLKVYLQRRKS